MIIGVGETINPGTMNIATHGGGFHGDDCTAVSILELAFMEKDLYVVRTRNLAQLNKADVLVDIGGGVFDHHMAGFDLCRSTGEKYASAGLVWESFGEKAIIDVVNEVGISIGVVNEAGMAIGVDEIYEIKRQIDKEFIIPVDMEDNGEKVGDHTFSFISKFLPTWIEVAPKYNEAFWNAEKIVSGILKEIIKDKAVRILTKKELEKRFDSIEAGILEIPAQTMPWLEDVISYNKKHKNIIKFVIFPYPTGGWAVQCVPPSLKKKFDKLVPFPKEWAGGDEETLPKISGIHDATFCHNGVFFARAKSKQSIIEMCNIAMKANL